MTVDWTFRRDHVRVFELHLEAEPRIRIDNREIIRAKFVDPQLLLYRADLPPFIRDYLVGGGGPARWPVAGGDQTAS